MPGYQAAYQDAFQMLEGLRLLILRKIRTGANPGVLVYGRTSPRERNGPAHPPGWLGVIPG